jgi:hypothetical protein
VVFHFKAAFLMTRSLKTGLKLENFLYTKEVNVPVVRNEKGETEALIIRNPKTINKYHSVVMKQMKKWVKTGSIEWVEKANGLPSKFCSSIVIAPKAGPELYRLCFNGGPIKYMEKDKQPCKLEPAAMALKCLQKGDLMCKVDDKSGFHQ